jgi:hypothetical protein
VQQLVVAELGVARRQHAQQISVHQPAVRLAHCCGSTRSGANSANRSARDLPNGSRSSRAALGSSTPASTCALARSNASSSRFSCSPASRIGRERAVDERRR